MDVSKQLQAYEVEYHVLQDELLDTPPTLNQQQRAAQLERTNQSLRQQNLDLLEELQVTHTNAQTRRQGSLRLAVTAAHCRSLPHSLFPTRCHTLASPAWRARWRIWRSPRAGSRSRSSLWRARRSSWREPSPTSRTSSTALASAAPPTDLRSLQRRRNFHWRRR